MPEAQPPTPEHGGLPHEGPAGSNPGTPADSGQRQLLQLFEEVPPHELAAYQRVSTGQGESSGEAWASWSEVELSFSTALLGLATRAHPDMSALERARIEQIEGLVRLGAEADLPRLPRVLPQILSLSRKEEVSPRELSDLIAHDPGLVGEVLHLANSPLYRSGEPLHRLDDAVMRLGQSGIRRLVTQVALRPIFNSRSGHFSQQAGTRLWALSERCAHACTYLHSAQGLSGADPFNAFLAGLMAHVGTMAGLRCLDLHGPSPELGSAAFHRALGLAHQRLSSRIAVHWALPDPVCLALKWRAQHLGAGLDGKRSGGTPWPAEHPDAPLAAGLLVADRASQMHLLHDTPRDAAVALGEQAGAVALGRCLHALDRGFRAG
jgi:HD-like signal output (HDOD) protein